MPNPQQIKHRDAARREVEGLGLSQGWQSRKFSAARDVPTRLAFNADGDGDAAAGGETDADTVDVPDSEPRLRWYHTTSWYSALQILHDGIDCNASQLNHDFSCANGFYLNRTIDAAFDIGRSRLRDASAFSPQDFAILVYAFDADELATLLRDKYWTTNEPGVQWKTRVMACRRGRDPNDALALFGPLASSVGEIRNGAEPLVIPNRRHWRQLCIKSRIKQDRLRDDLTAVEFIESKLIGVLFVPLSDYAPNLQARETDDDSDLESSSTASVAAASDSKSVRPTNAIASATTATAAAAASDVPHLSSSQKRRLRKKALS